MQETTDFNTGEWKPQDAYNRASNLRKYVDEVIRIKKHSLNVKLEKVLKKI